MPKIRQFGENNQYEWVDIHVNEVKELGEQLKHYNIDPEMLEYAMDRNERARVEFDNDHDTFVIIYNVPDRQKIHSYYDTMPLTFFIQDKRMITLSNNVNEYILTEMNHLLDQSSDFTVYQFLFSSLYVASSFYFALVEEMDRERNVLNHKLQSKTTKDNLIRLSNLETGTAYFRTASKQNVLLLQQIKTHAIGRQLNDVELEQLDDALIEAKQLVEMTELSAQILEQLSNTYNNVLNNNLNETMRILTVLSILLTVPTIVTGFFGMNMPLPLEDNVMGWVITIGISAVGWMGLSHILNRLFK